MSFSVKHFFLFLFPVLLLSSCISIEKRLYRDGFYVDWQARKTLVRNGEPEELRQEGVLVACNDSPQGIMIDKLQADAVTYMPDRDTLAKKKKHRRNNELKKFDEKKDVANPDNLKLSPWAIAGLILGVGYIALFVVWSGFVVILSLAGLIASMLAKRQIKKYPDKYFGKTISAIGFWMNFIIFGYIFALFLLFVLFTWMGMI